MNCLVYVINWSLAVSSFFMFLCYVKLYCVTYLACAIFITRDEKLAII